MSATILQEVEEAFAHSKDKLAGMQQMMRTDSVLKNEIELHSINEYALEKAMTHGVDPHLQRELTKFGVVSSGIKRSSGTLARQGEGTDPVVEEQLSILLKYLNARDLSVIHGVDTDEDEFSSREIFQSMKLPKTIFEPLLKLVKSSRPALHKTLLSQPMISGESKLSNISRKKRRGLIVELKNKQKKSKSRSNSLGEHPDGDSDKEGTDKRRSLLASVVGKGVAEESMTSYLIVVCLLLNIMKEERIKGGKAGSGGGRKAAGGLKASELDESAALSSVPVANVIGALFEKRDNLTSASETREAVPNPFRKFLLSTLDASSNNARKASNPVAVSAGDSEADREEDVDEKGSKQGRYDTVGEPANVLDEQSQEQFGEAAVLERDGEARADISVDNVSADESGSQRSQQLAMTIRSDVTNISHSGMSDTGSIALPGTIGASSETTSHGGTIDYGDHDGDVDEEILLAAGEAGRSSLVGDNDVLGTSSGGGSHEISSPVLVPGNHERIGTPVGESLPDVPLLATYGPFCSVVMHRVIEQKEISMSSQPHIPSIPLQDIVVALLAALAASADYTLGVSSAPLRGHESENTMTDGSKSTLGLKDPLTSRLAMTPNAVNFMLVEYTLDVLFEELTNLSKNIKEKGKDLGHTKAFTAGEKGWKDEKGSPGSHLYFVSWCIGAVLKTLCASLQVASETNLPANSLGLGVVSSDTINVDKTQPSPSKEQAVDVAGVGVEGIASGGVTGGEKADKPVGNRRASRKRGSQGAKDTTTTATTATTATTTATTSGGDPFIFRLLRKIAACMGLPANISGEYLDSVGHALSAPDIINAAHTSGPVSSHLCRHFLSIVGIDVFVCGLPYFFPQAADRGLLLQTLLKTAPKYSEAARFCNFISPYLVTEPGEDSGAQEEDKANFYLQVCLQKLCGRCPRTIKSSSLPIL